MLFRNDTKDKIKYRVGTHKEGYSFFTIRPGETADFEKDHGTALGLTKVVEKKELKVVVKKEKKEPLIELKPTPIKKRFFKKK